MTDIVERLRDHADRLLLGGRNTDTRVLCEEAAQEIERLRASLVAPAPDFPSAEEMAKRLKRGSMAPAPEPDEPAHITDAEPNAPR